MYAGRGTFGTLPKSVASTQDHYPHRTQNYYLTRTRVYARTRHQHAFPGSQSPEFKTLRSAAER